MKRTELDWRPSILVQTLISDGSLRSGLVGLRHLHERISFMVSMSVFPYGRKTVAN